MLNTLKYKSSLVEDLEAQLAKVIEKNTELTIQNSDLQKKVVELREVTDECEQLKNTLTEVETECTVAKSEVKNLGAKVRNLECVLEEMHKAAENRREIERQHKEALEKLKQKQVVEEPLLIVEEDNIFSFCYRSNSNTKKVAYSGVSPPPPFTVKLRQIVFEGLPKYISASHRDSFTFSQL